MIERNHIFSFFLFLFLPFFCVAQEDIKYEKEIPIDSHLVPLSARTFVQSLDVELLHWVKEINFERRSYEAKILWNKLPASIEFDSTGAFEDVEITIAKNKVPAAVRKNIGQIIKHHFVKFNYAKFQLQFTGTQHELIKRMAQNDEQAQVTVKYEIELYGKIKTAWRMYEYLFDRNGLLEQKREISGVVHQYENF